MSSCEYCGNTNLTHEKDTLSGRQQYSSRVNLAEKWTCENCGYYQKVVYDTVDRANTNSTGHREHGRYENVPQNGVACVRKSDKQIKGSVIDDPSDFIHRVNKKYRADGEELYFLRGVEFKIRDDDGVMKYDDSTALEDKAIAKSSDDGVFVL